MDYASNISQIQRRDALLMEHKQLEDWMAQAKIRKEIIQKEILAMCFEKRTAGTNTYQLGHGYELKAVVQQKVKINKGEPGDYTELAAAVQQLPPEIQATILRWTPEISSTVYKSLTKEQQDIINTVCTVNEFVAKLEIKEPKQPTL